MRHQQFDIAAYSREMEGMLGDQEQAPLFWRAFSFAVDAHQDQRRKSGEPYVSHPCQVARIMVKELGVSDQPTLAAALLHDTVEDVEGVSLELVGELFGSKVEDVVDGCTKISNFQGDRQHFLNLVHRKLFSGSASRLEVILVKLADRLHNLRTMESMPKHKRQKIADETLSVYAPLSGVLGLFGVKRELYNLAIFYKFPKQAPKRLAAIQKLLAKAQEDGIDRQLSQALNDAWLSHTIRLKSKGLWSYYSPANGELASEIENPLEVIVQVDDVQTCYRALGVLNQKFPPIPRTIRDFIANAKPTGYQSLHARANIHGQNYLFKIRTDEMAHQAGTGIIRAWFSEGTVHSGFEQEITEMFNIMGAEIDLSYRDMIAASGGKEIYTYTPKGTCIYLPRQAIVLDFAFRVHTEIGHRCIGAKVGQQLVPPSFALYDGDRVQIFTQDGPVHFSQDIQALCQTPRARSELARVARHRRHRLAREVGRHLLAQEMKRYGLPVTLLDAEEMEDVSERFGLRDETEIFLRLGQGTLRLREVIGAIKGLLYVDQPTLQPPTGALNSIQLDSVDPAWVKLSRCCDPLPTEKSLYGLLSERGLSVHRVECRKVQELKVQREDLIELRWQLKETKVDKPQTLYLPEGHRRAKVFAALGKAPDYVTILEMEALSSKARVAETAWEVQFQVANLHQLRAFLRHLRKTANLKFEFVLEQ
ncbi:MAG: HD domain-containing protein [Thermodesulfobacteriota bacterium]